MRTEKRKWTDHLPAILTGAGLLILWQIGADMVNMKHILPSPVDILIRIWELRESLFLHHLPATLSTIGAGAALTVAIGIALAVLMHLSEAARAMLQPLLLVTQTVPVMCISPLFVLWLGYTLQAKLIAVVLSTFFAITLNTFDGLKSAAKDKREYLRSCGASRRDIFFRLEVPTALPKFVTALKMVLPWIVIDSAVAEWIGSTEGLGYFSKRMASKLDGAAVFAPVILLCVIALAGMAVVKAVDRRFVTWRSEV